MKSKVIIWKQDRVNYIIDGVCSYYGIGRDRLFKYCRKPEKMDVKRITIKLLKDVADLSIPEISTAMGYKRNCYPPVYKHYRSISDDISPNTYGNKELKRTYLDILEFLNL